MAVDREANDGVRPELGRKNGGGMADLGQRSEPPAPYRIYNITTINEDRSFSGLLEAIDRKFDQMTDATVEYRRLIAFKQTERQSVTSFFELYMEMVKSMDLPKREIRTYFVLKRRDEKLREHAAAFDLEAEAVVIGGDAKGTPE
jgi:hypothetical protein